MTIAIPASMENELRDLRAERRLALTELRKCIEDGSQLNFETAAIIGKSLENGTMVLTHEEERAFCAMQEGLEQEDESLGFREILEKGYEDARKFIANLISSNSRI